METPHSFTKLLDEAFHGRYRLRWSDTRQEFHLEQKVHTGQVMAPPTDPDTGRWDSYSDGFVRARDGYMYVMAIRTGDRMPCPVCNYTVKVPIMQTKESKCERCIREGRDGKYVAAYYPLNHMLIEHLQQIDPFTDGPLRSRQRMRANQVERLEKDKQLDYQNLELAVTDDHIQLDEVPMSGYGPKHAAFRV